MNDEVALAILYPRTGPSLLHMQQESVWFNISVDDKSSHPNEIFVAAVEFDSSQS